MSRPPTRIVLVPEVLDDFDRFFEHIAQFDRGSAPERIGEIVQAIDILQQSPAIGRKVKNGKRELVIGRGTRGYVALYRYVPALDTVFVLAVRAQREATYRANVYIARPIPAQARVGCKARCLRRHLHHATVLWFENLPVQISPRKLLQTAATQ